VSREDLGPSRIRAGAATLPARFRDVTRQHLAGPDLGVGFSGRPPCHVRALGCPVLNADLPPGCKKISACLDYAAYAFDLPSDRAIFDLAAARRALMALGRIEREDLGVVYIRSDWGHMILPPSGFPELKVVFHHDTDRETRRRILNLAAKAIVEARCGHRE